MVGTRKAEARETPQPAGVLDLERYVPGLLTFMANKLSRSASSLYARRFGVNVTEWRILSQIAIEPGLTAARLCQVIGFDKGPVSRTLAAMERDGLIVSEPDGQDARRRLLRMTDRGRSLHDAILPVALDRERRLLSCLTEGERDTLLDLLNRIHGNLAAVTREDRDR